MKLYVAFNGTYRNMLETLKKSFPDAIGVESDLTLLNTKMTGDPYTPFFCERFVEDTKDHRDNIYGKKSIVFETCTFCTRLGLVDLWPEMVESEREDFWERFITMMRYTSMVEACGAQLGNFESMAMNFMRSNPNMQPDEFHSKLFQEMLSGGAFSQELMKVFSEKSALKNMLRNVGNIMRPAGDEKGLDLSGLESQLDEFDFENMDTNFDQIREMAQQSGMLEDGGDIQDLFSAAQSSIATAARAMQQNNDGTCNPEATEQVIAEAQNRIREALQRTTKRTEHKEDDDEKHQS